MFARFRVNCLLLSLSSLLLGSIRFAVGRKHFEYKLNGFVNSWFSNDLEQTNNQVSKSFGSNFFGKLIQAKKGNRDWSRAASLQSFPSRWHLSVTESDQTQATLNNYREQPKVNTQLWQVSAKSFPGDSQPLKVYNYCTTTTKSGPKIDHSLAPGFFVHKYLLKHILLATVCFGFCRWKKLGFVGRILQKPSHESIDQSKREVPKRFSTR